MLARIAADGVVLVHAAFIVFVVLGGFAVLRWPRIAWLHIPAAVYGALIELQGFICPLTPLEVSLRRTAGEQGYTGGFIEHYVIPVVYPAGLTRELQIALGVAVIVINLVAYTMVVVSRRRSR